MVDESQDWWLRDQSALATGFDNWVDSSGVDWNSLTTSPQLNGNGSGTATSMNTMNGSNGNGMNSMDYDLYTNGYQLGNVFEPVYGNVQTANKQQNGVQGKNFQATGNIDDMYYG